MRDSAVLKGLQEMMKGCQPLLLIFVLWGGWLSSPTVADNHGLGCRTLRFAKPVDEIALHGHVIENISINVENDEVLLECRVMCLYESTCVSINIGPPASDGARLCQLSNSDHIRHAEDLKPQEGFLYWVSKDPCTSYPCLHNATCLNGFTDKRYICLCQAGYTGEHCETGSGSSESAKTAATCKESNSPICQNPLFGETGGKLYTITFPQNASDNWLEHATAVGTEGWNDFKFLFFHPDGTLYGVLNDKFYKGPPPDGVSAEDWVADSKIIGTGAWNGFQFLFFHPEGMLYGVHNGKFYKRLPPAYGSDNWLGTATLVASGGWSVFKFLFFDPDGNLYGVENGKFHMRSPPKDVSDHWLTTSTLIGSSDWNDFQFLFFMPDGILYGVNNGKFYKRSPPTNASDDWLGSAEMIGSGGWKVFKFLMTPLQ